MATLHLNAKHHNTGVFNKEDAAMFWLLLINMHLFHWHGTVTDSKKRNVIVSLYFLGNVLDFNTLP